MGKDEQGLHLTRYSVVPRTLVFIFDREHVLLIKGAPYKRIWANKYNGIGGHVERGETIQASAARELAEESGLSGVQIRLAGVMHVAVEDEHGVMLFIFSGEYTGSHLVKSSEGTLEWVPLAAMQVYPLVEDLPQLIQAVIEQRRSKKPFCGRSYYDDSGALIVEINPV